MPCMEVLNRIFELSLPKGKSAFLWGPRKVGKSYWIRQHMSDAILIDLLKTDVQAEYLARPALLRERFSEVTCPIVIDEVQMVPSLLDEVHWLIENKGISFLSTGSSPRKLRRGHANLLGGRAWRYTMMPLTSFELGEFSLDRILVSGLLPPHVLSVDPIQDLRAYVADYLKEEIIAEAVVQNIPAFSEFLRIAALTSGELLNYSNVAREVGISNKIIRNYFQILEDTLLGYRLAPWRKVVNRRLIETEKFYLFDVGVSNFLAQRTPGPFTSEFGKSFEHFIFMELKAYQAYKFPELKISYWRTASGVEVDFVLGEMAIAIEIKTAKRISIHDAKGLLSLDAEYSPKRLILVSFESEPRKLEEKVECYPWRMFLELLWADEFKI